MTDPVDQGCDLNTLMYDKLTQLATSVKEYTFNGGESEQLTPYQQYAFRTASVHKTIDELDSLGGSQTSNVAAVITDLLGATELADLVDIRQSPAYIQFIQIVESFIDWEKNGYEDLAKEYKRELKYAAGNLMGIHLRQMVQQSVSVFANFFEGFRTFEQLRAEMPGFKPLRQLRPMMTKFVTDRDRQLAQQREEELKF